MNQPLVSVVVPTYKGSDVISKTIDGILKQDYKNIEIIIVDDNGKGTPEQLKTEEIVKNYPNIKYEVHEVNKKGSAARNTGMRVSKGKYIAFLDDDDVWLDTKISAQVDKMEKLDESYGLIYGPFIVIYRDNTGEVIEGGLEGKILYNFLMGEIRIGSSLMMIRRSILNVVKGFDESFSRHQDWEFITRISRNYKIAYCKDAWTLKYMMKRNSPKDVKKIEENRLYFLNKMKPIIDELTEKQKDDIYNYHYTFIAKEYLKRKNIKMYFYWINNTTKRLKAHKNILIDGINNIFLKKKRKNIDKIIKGISNNEFEKK